MARICGIERDAGQEGVVGMPLVDVGDDLGLARPQQNLAPRAAQRLRQRRPPGSAADDADFVDLHGRSPLTRRDREPSTLAGLMPSRRHR